MKSSIFGLTAMVLLSVTSLAQERSRSFDNFDTARGVQVQSNLFVPIANKLAATVRPSAVSASEKKMLLKPTSLKMRANEGLATREMSVGERQKLMMGNATHLKGFTTGNPVVDSYIVESSRKYRIDPLLIYAQMHQESSFKQKAVSHKGASGLMQLMPATARRLGVTNIFDPQQNIDGGVKYMRMLLDMFGQDVNLALAGYNAGEGAVMKYGYKIPPYSETREYVRRISARYASISDPMSVRHVPKVNNSIAAKLVSKESKPLNLEQNAVAIKLPDGRMRLVNQ
jgi:soluble lytic murein transglycosylase-like protein